MLRKICLLFFAFVVVSSFNYSLSAVPVPPVSGSEILGPGESIGEQNGVTVECTKGRVKVWFHYIWQHEQRIITKITKIRVLDDGTEVELWGDWKNEDGELQIGQDDCIICTLGDVEGEIQITGDDNILISWGIATAELTDTSSDNLCRDMTPGEEDSWTSATDNGVNNDFWNWDEVNY